MRKTESIRKLIKSKFGSINDFERMANLKPGTIHNALIIIDKSKNVYFKKRAYDKNDIIKLIKSTKPTKKVFLSESESVKIRNKILERWGNFSNFLNETKFGRVSFYATINGKRKANDLIEIINSNTVSTT